MLATIINAITVAVGGILGLLLRNSLSEKLKKTFLDVIGLYVISIGIGSAIKTQDSLGLVICFIIGTLIGEALDIERRAESMGDALKKRVGKGGSERFTEGFVSMFLIACVGAMTVNGSIEAGINGNNSIILAKSVMDLVSAVALASSMGIGVALSAIPLLIYQGALVLLASWVGPYLGTAVTTEMSAVGGLIVIGIGVNMLALRDRPIRVGNMVPAIFMPIIYIPLVKLLSGLF